MEDAFYQSLIANRTPVHVRCVDGYELARAVLRDVGTYSLLLDVQGATELVYKHAILSIRPMIGRLGAGVTARCRRTRRLADLRARKARSRRAVVPSGPPASTTPAS